MTFERGFDSGLSFCQPAIMTACRAAVHATGPLCSGDAEPPAAPLVFYCWQERTFQHRQSLASSAESEPRTSVTVQETAFSQQPNRLVYR